MADNDKITIEFDFRAAKALQDIQKSKKELDELKESWGKATASEQIAAHQASRSTIWKTLTTDFDKLGESLERTHPRLLRLGQGIGNVAGGVATGAAAISGFGYALASFAAHAQQTEAQVSRLGAAYAEVAAQTNGAMSAGQALQLQGQIQAAGVQVNAHQLGLLARAAREFAAATGNDASEAVEKLTNAIVNNSEDALSELNLSQARASSSTQTLANMTAALEERFRSTAPTARTLKEDLDKLPDAFTAIAGRALQEAVSGLERLADRFSSTGRAGREFFLAARAGWREIVEAGDTLRNVEQQSASTAAMNARLDSRRRMSDVFAEGRVQLDIANEANFGDLRGLSAQERARVMRAATPGMWDGSSASESVNRELRSINEERLQSQSNTAMSSAARAAMEADADRKVRKTGEQMARAGESAAQLADRLNKAKELAVGGISQFGEALTRVAALVGSGSARTGLQSMRSVLGLQSLSDEESADLFGGISDAQEGGGPARREETARRQRRRERNRETRRAAREQSIGGRVSSSLGFRTDEEGRIAAFDGATEGASMLSSAVGTLQSGLSTLFETLVTGSMDAGTAFQAFTSSLLSELGKMAINKGLFYTFEGIAALFSAPPAAPMYFAAGAGLLALGAGLGAAGAATKPQVPGPSAGGTGTARGLAPRSSGSSDRSALGGVTVYLGSLVPAGARDAQQTRDGLRLIQRRGFDDATGVRRRVEH